MEIILIGHNNLGNEMKNATEMIIGSNSRLHSIGFYEKEGLSTLEEKIEKKIDNISSPVLIFTDITGGTPYNASCAYALKNTDKEVHVLSGMSLPLVIELLLFDSKKEVKEIIDDLEIISKDTFKAFNIEENITVDSNQGDEL